MYYLMLSPEAGICEEDALKCSTPFPYANSDINNKQSLIKANMHA